MELEVFEHLGQIELFEHADSALDAVTKTAYDLIVIDPRLAPGFNYPKPRPYDYGLIGLDLVKRIRAEGQNTKTPVVVIYKGSRDRDKGHICDSVYEKDFRNAGANEVISIADCMPDRFCDKIKTYLQNK
jgi:CheY-like chemotaxis protein